MERKTKIVCTIGPATESKEMLVKMANQGMNVCRMNFSHETHDAHLDRINRVRDVAKESGKKFSILLDTKGPEVRCGVFKNGQEFFETGDMVNIVRDEVEGTKEQFHIHPADVFEDVEENGTVLIDDGKMRLTIVEKLDGVLKCRVENPGYLKSRKGVNLPNVKLSMPFISPKDESDIRFGAKHNVDYIAASFTRRPQDILDIRAILESEGNANVQIIAKIENQEGYDNLDGILAVADGIMVARGDLGVDVSFELVPIYQKHMIRRANAFGKPVITATHMLDTMTSNPRPTRAEASDVANAVLDGTDAIMLSGESAIGAYPLEAVHTMDVISQAMENVLPYRENLNRQIKTAEANKEDSIGIAAADTSLTMDCAAIVVFTQSGASAKRISKFRPKCPIFAVTFDESVQRRLSVVWGVNALLSEVENTEANEIELACEVAKANGVKAGENIVIVAGYPAGVGATNAMKIIQVK